MIANCDRCNDITQIFDLGKQPKDYCYGGLCIACAKEISRNLKTKVTPIPASGGKRELIISYYKLYKRIYYSPIMQQHSIINFDRAMRSKRLLVPNGEHKMTLSCFSLTIDSLKCLSMNVQFSNKNESFLYTTQLTYSYFASDEFMKIMNLYKALVEWHGDKLNWEAMKFNKAELIQMFPDVLMDYVGRQFLLKFSNMGKKKGENFRLMYWDY